MRNANEIAYAFIKLSDPEAGDVITNLKLQKLLYYAQGFHLALNNGTPFFSENVMAWEHGPVVKEVYDEFKKFGSEPLSITNTEIDLTSEERDLIKQIWNLFGQFSAWRLRDMTHSEAPWKNTTKNQVISHEVLMNFFKTQITS